jgi:hypothetical protein
MAFPTNLRRATYANEYLQVAYEQLMEVYSQFFPEEMEDGKAHLTHETMKKWQKQLLSVQGTMFVIYLYWCGYALHRYDLGDQ